MRIDAPDGALAWSRPLSARVRATPAVLGEVAVVADFKGRVAAVKTADGSVGVVAGAGPARLLLRRPHPGPLRRGLPRRPRLRSVPRDRRARVRRGDGRARRVVARGARRPLPRRLHRRPALPLRRAGPTLARLNLAAEGIQSSPALDATGRRHRQRPRPPRLRARRREGAPPPRLARDLGAGPLPGRGPATSSSSTATCATFNPSAPDYVSLAEGLKRLCARREVLALYDVSSGLSFGTAAQEKAFRKALGFKGPLPSDPARALVLLDALVTTREDRARSVAVVLDYAHALAPSGPRLEHRASGDHHPRPLGHRAQDRGAAAVDRPHRPRRRRRVGRGLRGRVRGRGGGGPEARPGGPRRLRPRAPGALPGGAVAI